MTRKAVFADQGWYPRKAGALRSMLDGFMDNAAPAVEAVACLVPHAGYSFSGPVAGAVFARIEAQRSALILAVSHRPGPAAPDFALWSGGAWETPIGAAAIDEELRDALRAESGIFTLNEAEHMHEHSGELQVPFLVARNPDVKINVIAVSTHALDSLTAAGEAAASAIRKIGKNVLIVGSGDMSHEQFQAASYNKSQDEKTFPFIESVDAEGFFNAVSQHNVSTCGSGTFTTTLAAAKALGATGGELVKYGSSARGQGVQDYVVSYAGFVIK
jgi:AmmeMemoRadiSam system protein B